MEAWAKFSERASKNREHLNGSFVRLALVLFLASASALVLVVGNHRVDGSHMRGGGFIPFLGGAIDTVAELIESLLGWFLRLGGEGFLVRCKTGLVDMGQ